MTTDDVRSLYEYNAWANERILGACEKLSAEQFTRSVASSFPSVRDTLAHILGAEWLWLERWQGRMPTELPAARDFPDLESLRERWAEVSRGLTDFVCKLRAEDLERVHQMRTTKGETYSHAQWEMMQHLVNHGTYHRGQVTTMLRQLGAAGVATDLIVFYRQRQKAAKVVG